MKCQNISYKHLCIHRQAININGHADDFCWNAHTHVFTHVCAEEKSQKDQVVTASKPSKPLLT